MDLRKVCQNRTYVFELESDPFDGADEIIKKILNHAGLGIPTEISFITANYNYDAYKVETEDQEWFVKFSLDPSLDFTMEDIHGKFKFGDEISYAITPFIKGENLKMLGVATLLENKEQIIQEYFAQNGHRKVTQGFPAWIMDAFKASSLEELTGEAVDAIKAHSDWEIIQDLAKGAESEMTAFSSEIESKFKKRNICHGNLKPSNIIKSEDFVLVDYDNAFYGNQFLDLASLMIWSGISGKAEKDFFSTWLEVSGQQLSQSLWIEYKTCYEFVLRKIFLEIMVGYLKEVYVLTSTRPIKILHLIDVFAQHSVEFRRIASVAKHYEFITRVMLEPIIGAEVIQEQS